MSSFPNSWEPYGSSQRSELGWRKAATRPMKQTLSDRWKNAQAKILQPAPRAAEKNANVGPRKTLDLGAFQRAEEERRSAARFEGVRNEIRGVGAAVKELCGLLEDARADDGKAAREEIGAVQAALIELSEQVKKVGSDGLGVEGVRGVVRESLRPLLDEVERLSTRVESIDEGYKRGLDRVEDLIKGLSREFVGCGEEIGRMERRFTAVEEGIGRMFEEHARKFEDVVTRLEDWTKPIYEDETNGEEYEEGVEKEIYGVRAKANDFNVGLRNNMTSKGSTVDKREVVIAKLRIRPRRACDVIDLTKPDSGDVNLFEEDDVDDVIGTRKKKVKTEDEIRGAPTGRRYLTRSAKRRPRL